MYLCNRATTYMIPRRLTEKLSSCWSTDIAEVINIAPMFDLVFPFQQPGT